MTSSTSPGLGAVLILTVLAGQQASAQALSRTQEQSLPEWATEAFQRSEFASEYLLSSRLNPFLLQGDFNGDNQADVAVLVSRRGTGARGIAVVHAGSAITTVVGAGNAIGNGGDDFSWMDAWSVYPKGAVHRGTDESKPPTLRGDALLVEKLEAASALIYWDGAAYRWYQQGD